MPQILGENAHTLMTGHLMAMVVPLLRDMINLDLPLRVKGDMLAVVLMLFQTKVMKVEVLSKSQLMRELE